MSQPDPDSEKPAEEPPADSGAGEDEETKTKVLSPEEQMAAYEESLKETDWGHQPC